MNRLIVMVAALFGFTAVSVATAAASSAGIAPGGACVFNAQTAVGGLGHVGWGFELPTGNWEYGANDGGKDDGGLSGPSNTWVRTGSKAAMVTMFTDGGPGQDNHNYNRYRCATVADPDSYAAELKVNSEQGEPYYLYLQDCETDADHVLSNYGVGNLPSTAWFPGPDAWFLLLPLAGFGSIVSL